jgi:glycosyltransferase involved in cell wall biosynthesis
MIVYTKYATDARVRREAETLASNGFRVICLTNREGPEARTYVLGGVEVQELGVPKYRGKSHAAYIGSYVRFLGAASAACLRVQRAGRLDVVHVHNLPDFLVFAALLPRLRGAKVVLDVHDSIPETFASKFSDGAIRWRALCLEEKLSALVAHRVICVNHPQRDTLVARGLPASKTFVSMNVPDPRIFSLKSTEKPVRDAGPLNLVYHGTMVARLGVDLVIQAVHALRGRIPGLQLHLWGGGDDLDSFRALAGRLNVLDCVHFRPDGYPLEELPARLDAMDIGVVGNRRSVAGELMLPVKLLEYVALGIPVVAPRLNTIAHYFADDMVSYFEPDDVGSMADAIYRLHSQPDLRREQPSRAGGFLREHGWDRQGPELVSFYERLIAQRAD